MAAVGIASVLVAVGILGLSGSAAPGATSTPHVSAVVTEAPFGSGSATAPAASLSSAAAAYVDSLRWVTLDPAGRWVLASTDAAVPLPWTVDEDATVRMDFGRVIAATPGTDVWTFERLDGDKAVEMLSLAGQRAALAATIDPAGETLYFHAGTGEGDGGLYAFALAEGKLSTLVAPVAWTEPGSRISLEWSASGGTLASSLCDTENCDVDVVTTSTGAVQRIATRMTLRATTDRFVLGEDGTSGPFLAADIVSGTVTPIAKELIADAHEGYGVGENRFLLGGLSPDRSEYRIALADAAAGETDLVVAQPAADALPLTRLAQSPDWALLGTETITDLWAKGGGKYALLDVKAGTIVEDAVQVQP